jgi:Catalase
MYALYSNNIVMYVLYNNSIAIKHCCNNIGVMRSLYNNTMNQQTMILFSDLGTPDGFRHMDGFGSHTFKVRTFQIHSIMYNS